MGESFFLSYLLTIMVVDNILEEKEPMIFMNPEIPEEKITLDQGYYCWFYVIIGFNKEFGF